MQRFSHSHLSKMVQSGHTGLAKTKVHCQYFKSIHNHLDSYLPTRLLCCSDAIVSFTTLRYTPSFIYDSYCFFDKWAILGLIFIHFRLFNHTLQFSQQINAKKYPSSIRYWRLNPRPLVHESPPITTRPGL